MRKIMMRGGAGVLVNNASVLGWRAQKEQCHYAAAKAGVMALTRCAALEAADHGANWSSATTRWMSSKAFWITFDSPPAPGDKRISRTNNSPEKAWETPRAAYQFQGKSTGLHGGFRCPRGNFFT